MFSSSKEDNIHTRQKSIIFMKNYELIILTILIIHLTFFMWRESKDNEAHIELYKLYK